MSSIAVRSELRAAWPAITPLIPYVETINTAPDNPDVEVPIWGTFVFDVISRGHITMGSAPWIEEVGTASIALMAYSGTGDDEIASMADVAVRGWEKWISTDGSIWIQSVAAPVPPDLEAVGDAYRLLVTLTYVYQIRGA